MSDTENGLPSFSAPVPRKGRVTQVTQLKPPGMSDTPRTDAVAMFTKGQTVLYGTRRDEYGVEMVPADLARQLERELALRQSAGWVLVPRELIAEAISLWDEIIEELYENTLEDRPLLGVGIEETRDKFRALPAAPESPAQEKEEAVTLLQCAERLGVPIHELLPFAEGCGDISCEDCYGDRSPLAIAHEVLQKLPTGYFPRYNSHHKLWHAEVGELPSRTIITVHGTFEEAVTALAERFLGER